MSEALPVWIVAQALPTWLVEQVFLEFDEVICWLLLDVLANSDLWLRVVASFMVLVTSVVDQLLLLLRERLLLRLLYVF